MFLISLSFLGDILSVIIRTVIIRTTVHCFPVALFVSQTFSVYHQFFKTNERHMGFVFTFELGRSKRKQSRRRNVNRVLMGLALSLWS